MEFTESQSFSRGISLNYDLFQSFHVIHRMLKCRDVKQLALEYRATGTEAHLTGPNYVRSSYDVVITN